MTPQRLILAVVAVLVVGAGVTLYLRADQSSRALVAAIEEAEHALETEGDPAKALRLTAEALLEHPEDASLLLLRGRAFDSRGRYTDALEVFDQAEFVVDEEAAEQLRFLKARARTMRYLETGDRGDFNVAEADLGQLSADPTYAGAAKILLGMGLIRHGTPKEHERARRLIREGLASPGVETLVDVDRARDWLARLG